MSNGAILQAGSYQQLLSSSQEFHNLVNAHKETAGSNQLVSVTSSKRHSTSGNSTLDRVLKEFIAPSGNQLIQEEEREIRETGLKSYLQYLNRTKGYYLWLPFVSFFLWFVRYCKTHGWLIMLTIPTSTH